MSEIDLFGELQSVVHLDPEIANGTFKLSMAKQQLARPQVVRQPLHWRWYALGLTFAVAGYGFRMVRFALYWAREVYAAYLALPDAPPVPELRK